MVGPVSFERSYGAPKNWPKINGFAWGEKNQLIGVITPLITPGGPPCIFENFMMSTSHFVHLGAM